MSDNLTGKTLGTCTLQKLIGRGGMGAVYVAQQTRPHRHIAVKVLLPDLIDNQKYSEFLARFRREADIVAQLQQVNIIPIYEYGEQDGIPYLVMPYLSGGSLQQILSQQRLLSLTDVMRYISQAAAALDYAHAHYVIHRDLKPANFLLADDGRLVLTDFGIARMLQDNVSTSSETLTRADTILGTPQYMAPEMFTGATVDYRADIYALGIILYQMLSGRVPFKGDTFYSLAKMHVQDAPPSLRTLRPDLPHQVDAVIQTALAKSADNRFQSAGALAQSLQHVLNASLNTSSSASLDKTIPATSTPFVTSGANVGQDVEVLPTGREPANTIRNTTGAGQPITPPFAFTTIPNGAVNRTNRPQPLLMFIGLLLILVLIVGGVLVGLQLNKGNAGLATSPQPRTTQPVGIATTAASATSQAHTTPTATVVQNTPQITPTTQATSLSKGPLLYSATSPGAASATGHVCDNGGEQWNNYNSPVILCQSAGMQINNPHNDAPDLVGTFLTSLPSGQFSISNYVIEVTMQQAPSSSADYGVYFRNQPGNQQGVYTFLVHPDGTWSAYVYNNTTSARTEIASGSFGDTHASATLDIVVNGATFAFYANGHEIGSVNNGIYSTGTVGLAVDAGGTITVSNFSLYQVA